MPIGEFRRDTWIQPRLVETGLRTHDGERGTDEGSHLVTIVQEFAGSWPWGLPSWIGGSSVTILDVALLIAELPSSGIARGSDALELDRAMCFLRFLHVALEGHVLDHACAFICRDEAHSAVECATAIAIKHEAPPSVIGQIVEISSRVCTACTEHVAVENNLCVQCSGRTGVRVKTGKRPGGSRRPRVVGSRGSRPLG